MAIKSWAEAHRYNGGVIRYLYEVVKSLDTSSGYDDTEVKADIEALEDAIGDESTQGTILARIKALEDAT